MIFSISQAVVTHPIITPATTTCSRCRPSDTKQAEKTIWPVHAAFSSLGPAKAASPSGVHLQSNQAMRRSPRQRPQPGPLPTTPLDWDTHQPQTVTPSCPSKMVTAEDSPQSFTPSRPTGYGPRLNEKSNSLPKFREQNCTCSGMHGGVEMVVHPGPDPRTRTKPSPARLTTDRLRPLHPTRLRQPTAGVQKDRPAIPSNHRSALIRQCSSVSAHSSVHTKRADYLTS